MPRELHALGALRVGERSEVRSCGRSRSAGLDWRAAKAVKPLASLSGAGYYRAIDRGGSLTVAAPHERSAAEVRIAGRP